MLARICAVLLAAVAAGCAPTPRAPLDSIGALSGDEMVVVGKVELVPPLKKGEQRIRGNVIGNVENMMYLIADDKPRPLPAEPAIADYAGRIEAPLGSTFFVRSKSAPFYVLGGVLFLELGGSRMDRAYFPGGLRIETQPGDRAIYIGTLRYHRDEFFEVSRVSVVDEYAEASKEYARKFGGGQPLRRALMKRN